MAARTWCVGHCDDAGLADRWDMMIDGRPLEGAYIERTEQGSYALRFPRLTETTVQSLETAMRILEEAPLTKRRGIAIGRQATEEDPAAFASISEACELLGVSRSRVTAMVANGVLSAKRVDGEVVVGRSSLGCCDSEGLSGPRGRFANRFVQYYPDARKREFLLVEVDAADESQVLEAKAFVDRVRNDGNHPGGARLIGYRAAMRQRSSSYCASSDDEGVFLPFDRFCATMGIEGL